MKYIDKKVFTHKPPGDSRQQMYYSCETESRYITALQVELVVPECRYLIKLCALLLFVLAIATFNFSTLYSFILLGTDCNTKHFFSQFSGPSPTYCNNEDLQ